MGKSSINGRFALETEGFFNANTGAFSGTHFPKKLHGFPMGTFANGGTSPPKKHGKNIFQGDK